MNLLGHKFGNVRTEESVVGRSVLQHPKQFGDAIALKYQIFHKKEVIEIIPHPTPYLTQLMYRCLPNLFVGRYDGRSSPLALILQDYSF